MPLSNVNPDILRTGEEALPMSQFIDGEPFDQVQGEYLQEALGYLAMAARSASTSGQTGVFGRALEHVSNELSKEGQQ